MRIFSLLIVLIAPSEGFIKFSKANFFRISFNSVRSIHSLFLSNKVQDIKSPIKTKEESQDSVHLKLTQQYGDRKEESKDNEVETVKILEFIDTYTNQTLIATLDDIGWNNLEHYAIHKFSKNLSICEDILKVERLVDLNDSNSTQAVIHLWNTERFLARSKDFPLSIMNKMNEEKIDQSIHSHVRRLKRVQLEKASTDQVFNSFLHQQIIHNHTISHYNFQPYRSYNDSLALLKEFLVWFRQEFPYYYDRCSHCSHQGSNPCYGLVYPSSDEVSGQAARTELYLCSQCNMTSRFPRFNDVTRVLHTRKGRCGEYSMLMMRFLQALGYHARWTVDKADHVWTEVYLLLDSNDNDHTSSSSHSYSGSDDNRYKLTNSGRTGRWVHVDPCEASINEPYIYQSWGKNQTYIFSYSIENLLKSPLYYHSNMTHIINTTSYSHSDNSTLFSDHTSSNLDTLTRTTTHTSQTLFTPTLLSSSTSSLSTLIDYAEDVTHLYTTDIKGIHSRREVDGTNQTHINQLLYKAKLELLKFYQS